MKIVFLAGADSVHSWRWVEFFARRGHEVHWISLVPFRTPVGSDIRGYELGPYPQGVLDIWRAARKVRQILRQVAPDLLHAHYVGRYGLVGALTGFRPLVETAWGSDVLLASRVILRRAIIRFVLQRADIITCDAYHMRDAIMEMGVDPARIRIIFFGTDTTRFRPGLDGQNIREQFSLRDATVVVSMRSLEPIYDVESLIRTVPLVLRENDTVQFLIAGTGSERKRLAALVAELGVADHVHFVGQVDRDLLPQYLASADIYVSTALSDAGLAASTAEAMACGLPVIVTDTAENRLWVVDGVGGFIVPPRDPRALAERILCLAKYPREGNRFGANNRRVIAERNNYCVEMEKMEGIYLKLANGDSRSTNS